MEELFIRSLDAFLQRPIESFLARNMIRTERIVVESENGTDQSLLGGAVSIGVIPGHEFVLGSKYTILPGDFDAFEIFRFTP
jgi:hypothetical protein